MFHSVLRNPAFRRHRQSVSLTLAIVSLVSVGAAAASTVSSSSNQCAFAASSTKLVGLVNLGNTCYLNSQLQCAYHIPLVRSLILNGLSIADVPDDATATTDGSSVSSSSSSSDEHSDPTEDSIALQALRRVFQDMSLSDGRAVAPRVLCQSLGIPVFEQQDSQEFWKLLLPALKLPALTDLYTGAYQDYIVALDGSGRERRREEAFLDVSLDISSSSSAKNSVEASLLQQFGEPELLSVAAGNAWRPEPGAEKVDAHKGYLLTAQGLPAILQLHLKRFNFDWNTESTTKLNDAFQFPSTLDLSAIVDQRTTDSASSTSSSDNNDSCTFELQAVVVHMGEYGSGHYYAYVRPDVRTDDWYRFNDEVVTKVRFAEVVRDAYGGKQPSLPTETIDSSASNAKKGNFLVRIIRGVFGQGGDNGNDGGYGYGGPKSNAYVLQYVRRCDIPKLYGSASAQ